MQHNEYLIEKVHAPIVPEPARVSHVPEVTARTMTSVPCHSLHQPEFPRPQRRLGAVEHTQSPQHLAHMVLHRALGDVQPLPGFPCYSAPAPKTAAPLGSRSESGSINSTVGFTSAGARPANRVIPR